MQRLSHSQPGFNWGDCWTCAACDGGFLLSSTRYSAVGPVGPSLGLSEWQSFTPDQPCSQSLRVLTGHALDAICEKFWELVLL